MNHAVEMGFRCYDIHTKLHKGCFRHSDVNGGGGFTDTGTDSKVIA
jgi:hypothetical protein